MISANLAVIEGKFMSREVRMVPPDWKHPKGGDGNYEPLLEEEMPDWSKDERTHYQMYESTSEGTPMSPPIKTQEELARWLVDNEASAFAGRTATYEEWLGTIEEGSAITTMMTVNRDGSKTFQSGVVASEKSRGDEKRKKEPSGNLVERLKKSGRTRKVKRDRSDDRERD